MSGLDNKELCCVRIEHVTRVSCKENIVHIFMIGGGYLPLSYGKPVEARKTYALIQEAMREAGNCWRIEQNAQEEPATVPSKDLPPVNPGAPEAIRRLDEIVADWRRYAISPNLETCDFVEDYNIAAAELLSLLDQALA